MFAWLRRRRQRAIEAEAYALIRRFDADAYGEARFREREASSEASARHWNRVALAVAHKTGKRVGLDTSTRMAMDVDLANG